MYKCNKYFTIPEKAIWLEALNRKQLYKTKSAKHANTNKIIIDVCARLMHMQR